jgi:hypothetical protein
MSSTPRQPRFTYNLLIRYIPHDLATILQGNVDSLSATEDSPSVPYLESDGFPMEMASTAAVSQFNNLIKHFNDFLCLMTVSSMKGNARQSRIKNLSK